MSEDQLLSMDAYEASVDMKYYKSLQLKNKDDSLNFEQFILNFLDSSYQNRKAFLIYDDAKTRPNGNMFPGTQIYCLFGATVKIDYRDSTEEKGFSLINKIHLWGTSETIQKVKDTLIKKLKDLEIKES